MTATREELEHAYTTGRRLRSRLAALARIAGARAAGTELAEIVGAEAVSALDASACVLTAFARTGQPETLAVCDRKGLEAGALEHEAAHMAREVAAAGETLARPGYVGVPLASPEGKVVGVTGVFAEPSRHFNEEDGWWLKAAAHPLAASLHVQALEQRVRELEGAAARGAQREPEPADEGRALSVLVVDDDRSANDLICELVKMEGHRSSAAFDGLEGSRLFRPSEHDVVITDVAMPLMNGWELIAELRAKAPGLPVVLVTGYGSTNWNATFLQKHGVCALLHKPLDVVQFKRVLRKLSEQFTARAA